jgi:glucose-6-phosphate dehydrogenase assembly protein OpcA
MEDVMSTTLLSDGVEVPFADIAAAVERGREEAGGRAPARALTATIAAIGPPERLVEAVGALDTLAQAGAVRAVLIPERSEGSPTARVRGNTIVLNGVKPGFVDNALAALRLSSLPTLVWWRSGTSALDRVVDLVDRIVLDTEPPEPVWARAVRLFDKTAFTDLRWTRLTRWRALMAQFFDMPDVRAAQSTFTRLSVRGADHPSARLFAAWLASALDNPRLMEFEFTSSEGEAISQIRLSGAIALCLQLAPSGRCVETTAGAERQTVTSRVVSLGDHSLEVLIREELRIRSRDRAFEAALVRCTAS